MAQPSTETDEAVLAPSELRYLVLAAQREGNRQLNRQLSDIDLTASQAEIILVLQEFGPITLKELGGLIVCETGSPSRIVDSLVKRALVVRSPDDRDRRAVGLDLSAKGRTLVPHLLELDHVIHTSAIDRFTPTQTSGLISSLRLFLTGTTSGEVLERRFAKKRKPIREMWADSNVQNTTRQPVVASRSDAATFSNNEAIELARRLGNIVRDVASSNAAAVFSKIAPAVARMGMSLSRNDWDGLLAGSTSVDSAVVAAIADIAGVPPEYLTSTDARLVQRLESDLGYARTADDAGMIRVSAQGALSAETLDTITEIVAARIGKNCGNTDDSTA